MSVLPRVKDYDSLYRQFRWPVPARYNIGIDVRDRWAERSLIASRSYMRPDGREDQITYGWLRETSNRLAMCCAPTVSNGAIALPSCCRSRRGRCASHTEFTSSVVSLCRWQSFWHRCTLLPSAEFRRGRADHQWARGGTDCRDQERFAGTQARTLTDGAGEGALGFAGAGTRRANLRRSIRPRMIRR